MPGDAVAVAERDQPDSGAVIGVPGVPVRDARSGVDDLDVHQLGAQPHHRTQSDAGQRGDADVRLDPVRGDPDPYQVVAGLRQQQGTGGVAEVPDRRRQPGVVRLHGRQPRTLPAAHRPRPHPARRPRRSATRRSTTSRAPICSPCRAARHTSGQAAAVAPLRDSPVSILRWTRARRSASLLPWRSWRSARSTGPRCRRPRRPAVSDRCPGRTARPASGRVSPASRSASASSGVATPEPLGARLTGDASALDHPVPVRLRLDHHHHRRRRHMTAQRLDVGREGVQVDHRRRRRRVDVRAHRREPAPGRPPGAWSGAPNSPITTAQCRARSCGGIGPGNRAAAIACSDARQHRGRPRPDAGGQHGGAEATEHVAGAGLTGPGRPRYGHLDGLGAGCGHQLGGTLEQHGRPGLVGSTPHCRDRVRRHLAALEPEQPRQLAGVRGEQSRARQPIRQVGAARRRRSPAAAPRRPGRRSRHRRRPDRPSPNPPARTGPVPR